MNTGKAIQRTKYLVLAAIALVVSAFQVSADENHYDNIIIGDRPAGMGGAYTAVADDPSGLYYNPAGIVYAAGNEISAGMNAIHITTHTYKNALGGQTNWSRNSSNFLPNFFGLVKPLANGKIGFSYAVLDSIRENQDQTFNDLTETANRIDEYVINFNNQENVYNAGVSYAAPVTKDLSWGVTLYGHVREKELILHQYIDFSDSNPGGGGFEEQTRYFSVNEYGFRPIFGVMWSPKDKWSLGANINKILIMSSESVTQSTSKEAGQSMISRTETVNNTKRDTPVNLRIGGAYFPSEKILFSADLSYYEATSDNRSSVINIAFGTEYYMTPKWAVRAGLFSNYANTPSLSTGGLTEGATQAEHVDLYGLSFSIGRFSRNSNLSLGFNYSAGSGKAQLFSASGSTAVLQDSEMTSLTVFLSATSSF